MTRPGTVVALCLGMRSTILAAGLLAWAWVGAASGTMLVRLDGGDAMAVEAYRVEGDRARLSRGGVDVTVPLARVREVRDLGVPYRPPAAIRRAPIGTQDSASQRR